MCGFFFLLFFLFAFRIILFSTGLEILLSTLRLSKEAEPNAGHVSSVVLEDWSSSVLWNLGNEIGAFLKLYMNKVLQVGS